MPTHTFGRKYDSLDVGRADCHVYDQDHRQGRVRKVCGDCRESTQGRRKSTQENPKSLRGNARPLLGTQMPLAFAFYPTTYTNHPQPTRIIAKLNINWKEIEIQILKTIGPVLARALTGTTISLRNVAITTSSRCDAKESRRSSAQLVVVSWEKRNGINRHSGNQTTFPSGRPSGKSPPESASSPAPNQPPMVTPSTSPLELAGAVKRFWPWSRATWK